MLSGLESVLHDARLGDAIVAIDGFEHVLMDESSSEGGKTHLLLSKLLGILSM